MIDIDSMINTELLDHAFAHVMSGEYHPDSTCCDDARTEILRRMGNDPVPVIRFERRMKADQRAKRKALAELLRAVQSVRTRPDPSIDQLIDELEGHDRE